MSVPVRQYPLDFATGDPPSFENFVPGPNREAAAMVRELAAGRGERYLYLAGPVGAGKTHLLVAAARAAGGFYFDPGDPDLGSGVTQGLAAARLVCLDGVGAAAGRPEWEQALFRLFNELESAGTPLVAADRSPPGRLGLALPDLASRLASGPLLRLGGLSEPDLGQVLTARARARGLELPPQVAAYVVRRERRDAAHLLRLLDRLDRQSFAAGRRLTIPFVRGLLDEGGRGLPRGGAPGEGAGEAAD